MSEVKRLLTLTPMWANSFGCSLVKAAGNTLFIEQISNLDYSGSVGLIIILIALSYISFASKLLLRSEKARKFFGPLKRIGCGMVCSR